MQDLTPRDLDAPAGESWQAALARLARVCGSVWERFVDEDTGEEVSVSLAAALVRGEVLHRHRPLDAAAFRTVCEPLGLAVPAAVHTLFCSEGGFSLYEADWECGGLGEQGWVLLQTLDAHGAAIRPLAAAIDACHGHGIAARCLGADTAAALNSRFAAFAVGRLDDYPEWSRHLVFDATGRVGSVLFQDDAWAQTQARIARLLQVGLGSQDVDALLQAHIQAALGKLFRRNDMPLVVPGFPLPEG